MSHEGNGDGRVVVTGLGMLTPLGHTMDATWKELVKGTSGVGCVTRFDAGQRVLEHRGLGRRDGQALGGEEEHVRRRLPREVLAFGGQKTRGPA